MNFLHRPTLIALGLVVFATLLYSAGNTARRLGRQVENADQPLELAAP